MLATATATRGVRAGAAGRREAARAVAALAARGAVARSAAPARGYFAETLRVKPVNLEARTTETPTYLTDADGATISPWHDIPLRAGTAPNVFNFVCEIPRGTTAKYEIATRLENNPIVQDKTKAGGPRFYALRSLVNYGALPRTYEDPDVKDSRTGLLGDGDPIDVCEIGSKLGETGGVYPVKVVGALAMIDGGEADWKLLAVRTDDPLAAHLDDVATAPPSVQRLMDEIVVWFRTYKVPEGKGENDFAFGAKWLSAAEAVAVIEETHGHWRAMIDGRPKRQHATQYGEEAVLKAALKKQPWLPPPHWTPFVPAAQLK